MARRPPRRGSRRPSAGRAIRARPPPVAVPAPTARPAQEADRVDREAAQRIAQVRTRFLTRNPFLGVVALGMPWVESTTVRYVTSDGERVYYNPEFARAAPPLLLEGHLFHAILHWALGHPWRGERTDARLWQVASDLALVELFLRSPYDYREVLPLKASIDLARGRSAEEIAAHLPPPEPSDGGAPKVEAEVDECWQEPAGEGEAGRDVRRRWRERLVRAAQSMAFSADDPGATEVLLGALGRPKVDWRAEIARFLQRSYAEDFSWVPPNRRHLARGLYLPGTRSRNVGDLLVAVDTSGSIDPDTARRFLSEVVGIAQLAGGSGRVVLVQADDRVRGVTAVRVGEKVPTNAVGGGGTDFRPVFDLARRGGRFRATGVIYLTDGDGTFPEQRPAVPVLWVMPEPREVPFGRCVPVPFL